MLLADKLGIPQVVNILPTLNTSEHGKEMEPGREEVCVHSSLPYTDIITSKFQKHKLCESCILPHRKSLIRR